MTISCSFGCPFEGRVDPGAVAELAARFSGGRRWCSRTRSGWRRRRRCARSSSGRTAQGFHGHDTRSTGYANCLGALEGGARLLDASVGGLGGCPYAPRATGNVTTEDLVYLLEGEGIETGVDLDALIEISLWLEGMLGRRLEGQVYRAGSWPPQPRTGA